LCSVSCEVFKHTLFHVTFLKVYFIVTTHGKKYYIDFIGF